MTRPVGISSELIAHHVRRHRDAGCPSDEQAMIECPCGHTFLVVCTACSILLFVGIDVDAPTCSHALLLKDRYPDLVDRWPLGK